MIYGALILVSGGRSQRPEGDREPRFRFGVRGGAGAACEIRDPLMQVRFLISLGELCRVQAGHQEAVSLLTEAATVSDARGFVLQRARALQLLDDVRAITGDLPGAGTARQQAAAIAGEADPQRCAPSCAGSEAW